MTKAYMILDLQFGSTGKGLLAGYLANIRKPDVCVTAWGPNAGHTYIDDQGNEYIHRMLANGIVSPRLKSVLIGPGSVIDLDALTDEIFQSRHLLVGKRLVIHPAAVVVTAEHRERELRNVKIGSTMKGTGAAVVDRILRDPLNNPTASHAIPIAFLDRITQMGIGIEVSAESYDAAVKTAELIQIEGAQGYSLSMYHGFYPYTTSRDVTPAQVMADCALPLSLSPQICGTLRTFPIRVSDRYDEDGNMIGTSGPCYPDQIELSWGDVGVEPERTTVTKLPRRIFDFSFSQLEEAVYRCAPTKLFLNFANYLPKKEVAELIDRINKAVPNNCRVEWIGEGPTHSDVFIYPEWNFIYSQEQEQGESE